MLESHKTKAILVLEDGTHYYGTAIGKTGTTSGEICFNTGMTGYQEVFTDPSYFGQLLVTTNAHIGNYGIKSEETESEKVQISGLICKNYSIPYSRKQANNDIQTYLEENNIVGISEMDTRALVRHIRNQGAMNAVISSEIDDLQALKDMATKVPSMEGLELASKVTTDVVYDKGNPSAKYRVAVLDFGTKQNILQCFVERGCYLRVFPAETSYDKLKSWNPDGYFLSNGPGDPATMQYAIDTVSDILEDKSPIFGICLGHQILCLASGITTEKMHHGHRGANHPVLNLISGKCEITSQNHGFGVVAKDIKKSKYKVQISHKNLNDNSIEGVMIEERNAFSVQFHPESSPGPHDSRYLFDEFVEMMKKCKQV